MQDLPDGTADSGDGLDGLIAGELNCVRVDGRDDGLDVAAGGVGDDGHDPGPPDGGRSAARQSRQPGCLGQGQASRRPRHEVQADRVRAGTERRENPLGVRDAADLDQGQPRFSSHVVWHRPRRHEGTGRRGRLGRAHERLADEGSVEPDGPPADQRSGLAHTRFADHQAVFGDERPQPQAMVRIDRQSAQIAVVQADEPGISGKSGLHLALIVDFDQRLEAELAGQADEPGQLLRRQNAGQEQDDVGTRRPQDG